MATSHTTIKTGIIENSKVRDTVERFNTKVIESSQPTAEPSNSNNLTTNEVNKLVLHFEKLSAFIRTLFPEFSEDGSGSVGTGV
ncbi:unnamed protein product [Cochlearia groenlandica]